MLVTSSFALFSLFLFSMLGVAFGAVRLPRIVPRGVVTFARCLAPDVDLSGYQLRILTWLSLCSDFRQGRAGDTLVVNAVAGSGKTFVLDIICRALATQLTRSGRPQSALFCAFNRHIRDELKRRLPGHVHVSTIHGLGFRLIGTAIEGDVAVDGAKYTRIARSVVDDCGALLGLYQPYDGELIAAVAEANGDDPLRATLNAQEQHTRTVRQWAYLVRQLVDKARVGLVRLDQHQHRDRAIEIVDELLDRYCLEVPEVRPGALAYDSPELVPVALAELCRRALLAGETQAKAERIIDFGDQLWLPHVWDLRARRGYMWILTDECQDLSPAQVSVVSRYRWMGGRLQKSNMIFVGDRAQAIYAFAGASCDSVDRLISAFGADELPLSVCYRCPTSHVRLAQRLVPKIEAASGAIEGSVVECARDVWLRDHRPEPGDLVICRRTAPLVTELFRLWGLGVRARVRGKKIGAQLIELAERFGCYLVDDMIAAARQWAARRCEQLEADGHDADSEAIETITDQVQALCGLAGNLTIADGQPVETVEELCEGIRRICLDDENETPTVWLSTIHRGKGLEAACVHVLEADRIVIPSRSAEQMQQENNLHYIALTRSKERLVLVLAKPRTG